MKEKIIFDCDIGTDDAAALLYALAADDIEIIGITAVGGNCSVEQAAKNACSLLEMIGGKAGEIPVCRGYDRTQNLMLIEAGINAHGMDGLGNANLEPERKRPENKHAVSFILEQLKENEDITVVATGPLTNIAAVISRNRLTASKIKRLVVMGGAIRTPGNITPAAEFNIYADPEAAKTVFSAAGKGKYHIPTSLVPLDVTHQVKFTLEHLREIGGKSEINKTISTSIRNYIDFYYSVGFKRVKNGREEKCCPVHDPLAMGVAIDESIVDQKPLYVEVETSGEITRGLTLADIRDSPPPWNEPNLNVCFNVREEEFLQKFIAALKKYA